PILTDQVRTFQKLRWADMPSNLLPTEFYGPEVSAELRLSSKSHWDVPVRVGSSTVHVLASHPTPPSFDGPEKRNQRRNHDEIRLWADYLSPGRRSRWIVDDAGNRGGLAPDDQFVILGDMNADPVDGDSWPGAIGQLLDHPRVQDPRPGSDGAVEAAETQGGANLQHTGEPRLDTADFTDDPAPGNLRVDYALPSRPLQVVFSAVYWPQTGHPGSELTGTDPFPASDHRLVRVDLQIADWDRLRAYASGMPTALPPLLVVAALHPLREECADGARPLRLHDVRWALDGSKVHRTYLEGHQPGAVYIDLDTELA